MESIFSFDNLALTLGVGIVAAVGFFLVAPLVDQDVLAIGRHAQILTIPGEAMPNIGFYLKRKMRGTHNLLFGLTNDAFGYILTKVDFQSFPRYGADLRNPDGVPELPVAHDAPPADPAVGESLDPGRGDHLRYSVRRVPAERGVRLQVTAGGRRRMRRGQVLGPPEAADGERAIAHGRALLVGIEKPPA
jgi:hypothetical protein